MKTKENLFKINRIWLFLISLCLAFSAIYPFARILFANALDIKDYLPSALDKYHYFETPKTVFCENSNVYVLDETSQGNILKVFSNTGTLQKSAKIGDGVSKIFVFKDIVYALENGDLTEYTFQSTSAVAKKTLLSYSADSPSAAKFDDLFITEYEILLLSGGKIDIFNKSTLILENTVFSGGVKMFTVYGNVIYANFDSGFNSSQIYYYDLNTNKSALALDDLSVISGISPSANGVAVLTDWGIETYTKGIRSLTFSASVTLSRALSFSYGGGSFYVLNGYKTIIKYSQDLKTGEEIIMSSGPALGFYRNPSSVSSRFGRIIVTDKGNNRIVIDDGKNLKEYTNLLSPVSACTDDEGRIYVANSENKIAIYSTVDGALTLLSNNTASFSDSNSAPLSNVVISSIKVDSQNNLLVLSDDNDLFLKRNSESGFKRILNGVYAIDAPIEGGFSYIVTDSSNGRSVKKLVVSQSGTSVSDEIRRLDETNSAVLDIAADGTGGFYALYNGNTVKRYVVDGISYQYDREQKIENAYTLKKISVSNIDFDDADSPSVPDYRDILALDSSTHSIKIISFKDFGVTFPDPTIVIKKADISEKTAIEGDKTSILRTINKPNGCNVFAQNSEVKILTVLPDGFKVIVQDFDDSKPYTKIIADRILGNDNDDPFIGYVQTAYLSDPIPYSKEPPTEKGFVWTDNINIYPVPSKQSIPFISSDINELTLKYFSIFENRYGYKDNFFQDENSKNGGVWYRVEYEKNGQTLDGFVIASTVSIFGGQPDLNIRPQVNAKIIAKDKEKPDTGAYVYSFDETTETYLIINHEFNYLAVDTDVEVVGTFDPSSKFTKVKYFTDVYGTLEGYVETASIQYRGVNLAQIIAVIIIIVTALIIVILVISRTRAKRQLKLKT